MAQLKSRGLLVLRRHAEVHLQRRKRYPGPPVSEYPPRAIYPIRRGLIDLSHDEAVFKFLGREERSARPIDWRPARHQHGTRLWLLNLHYMEYLEELDDRSVLDVIAEWIQSTPPYRPQYWKDTWNSYSLSIRVVVWMQQLVRRGLLHEQPILESLAEQIRFLEDHLETDIGGNHLIKNIKALVWAGRFFDGPAAARWLSRGQGMLRTELERQILLDGVHFELTPAYHRQVFADLLEIRSVLTDEPLKVELDKVLSRMATAMSFLIHPDGELAQFGDTSLDSDYQAGDLLRHWSAVSNWEESRSRTWDLPVSGFAGYRDDDQYFIVRAGRMAADELPAHGHGDVGSFEWSVGGRRFVVDTGVFEYDAGARRRWSRSTEAHNTVTVEGADQAEFWGSFRVGRRPNVQRTTRASDESFDVTISHDGFAFMKGNPVHRRTMRISRNGLTVEDRVSGGAGQEIVAHLTLHPDVKIDRYESSWRLITDGSAVVLETEAEVEPREVEWYPSFGRFRKTTQLVLRYGASPVSNGFRLQRINPAGAGT